MTEKDLVVNGVYRGKKPVPTEDGYNDRVITAVGKKRVYYLTEPMIRFGRKPGRTQIAKFLAWAGARMDVEAPETVEAA